MDETIIIKGSDAIEHARLLTLRRALQLEIRGMRRRGRSAYAIIKDLTGLRGSKQSVYDQLSEILDAHGDGKGHSRRDR